jgi:hypothetical protein
MASNSVCQGTFTRVAGLQTAGAIACRTCQICSAAGAPPRLTVNRERYLLSGVVLAIARFAGGDAMVHVATGRSWDVLDYLSPYFKSFEAGDLEEQ